MIRLMEREYVYLFLFRDALSPHKCKGCFNPETWDFEGGIEIEGSELLKKVIGLIGANGIVRNLSILGGEPLCEKNVHFVTLLVFAMKKFFPSKKIYIWTGYTIEELLQKEDTYINMVLNEIDYLIEGPYIEEERDITLKWRGSRNQRILTKEKINDIINNKK